MHPITGQSNLWNETKTSNFLGTEFDRINYGKGFVTGRLQILKKKRLIAPEDRTWFARDSHKRDQKQKPISMISKREIMVKDGSALIC
jgi:hypothetical protein